MRKLLAAASAAFFIVCTPAFAQWQTPNHSVPIGRGQGSGFKSAVPGAAGQVLTSKGASADPEFSNAPTINLVPTYVSAPVTDTTCASDDQSAGIQSAIDIANANYVAGSGVTNINLGEGVFCAQNLVIKSGVGLVGSNVQGSVIKLVAASTGRLFVTADWNTCAPSGIPGNTTCGPVRWSFQNVTLDGNATLNGSNPNGRILDSYSRSMYLNNVVFRNAYRSCWNQNYGGGSNAGDASDPTAWIYTIRFLGCNVSREEEDATSIINGTPKGYSVYWNGPTDSRWYGVFLGFSGGTGFIGIGQYGSLTWTDGETFLGGYDAAPGEIYAPAYSVVGMSSRGHNATLNNVNLTGGYLWQILARTGGFTRFGGIDYSAAMQSYTGSLTIGTGAVSITVNAGYAPVSPGQPIEFYQASNPANYAKGTVTSYNRSTGALVMNITTTGGSGTHTDWLVGPMWYQGVVQLGDPANNANCPSWFPAPCWVNVATNYFFNVQVGNMNRGLVNGASNGGYNSFSFIGDNNTHVATIAPAGLVSTDKYQVNVQGLTSYCFQFFCDWSTFSSTVTSSVGSFTTVAGSGHYTVSQQVMDYDLTILITTNGTAAGDINATLPAACSSNTPGYGVVAPGSGYALAAISSGALIRIWKYDFTYAGGDNYTLNVSGRCRIN